MPAASEPDDIQEPRLWRRNGWTARVIKNEDDDGWAVEMTRHGDSEPALTGPWTMGRDKKNPKPLDLPSFMTLVKTAREVLIRHEAHRHAQLHKSATVHGAGGAQVTVRFDIAADEDDPHAVLTAEDDAGAVLASVRVAPDYKFSSAAAARWMDGGCKKP